MVLRSASSLVMQIHQLGEDRAGWYQVGATVHVSPRRSTAIHQAEMGKQSPGQEGFLVRLGASAGAGLGRREKAFSENPNIMVPLGEGLSQ